MTRLTFSTLAAQIASLLADNTTGDISPADVRQVARNTIDTFQPSDAALTGIPSAAQSLTTGFAKLTVFNAVSSISIGSGATDFAPNVGNDNIVINALTGIFTVGFSCSASGPVNDDLVAAIFLDNVEQPQKSEVSLSGGGNFNELSFAFPIVVSGVGPHTVEIRVRLRAGSASVTFIESLFFIRYVPGQ